MGSLRSLEESGLFQNDAGHIENKRNKIVLKKLQQLISWFIIQASTIKVANDL